MAKAQQKGAGALRAPQAPESHQELQHTMFDAGEVRRGLEMLFTSGQVVEVRALDAVLVNSTRQPATISGYFDDANKLVKELERIQSAKAICYTPNPINSALLARAANRIRPVGKEPTTSDSDVTRRHWLLVDCDPVRPSGISSTYTEHTAAIELAFKIRAALVAEGWPEPIVCDSGNGAQLMYRIDLPAADAGLVEKCLAALAQRLSADDVVIDRTVHNPARIWRLPGTRNCKGDNTVDRPHRMARVLESPKSLTLVPVESLHQLATRAPATESIMTKASSIGTFDLERWIAEHNLMVSGPEPWQGGRRWVFDVCPWNVEHTNRSAFIVQRADGKIGAGCHHNGCADKHWHDLRDIVEPGWQDRKPQGDSFPDPKGSGLSRNEFRAVPASALGNGESILWTWHGWLAAGFVTLLIGYWKAGKTTLLGHVMMATAQGGDVAGRVQAGRWLVVSEEGQGLWARRRDELGINDNVLFNIRPFKVRPRIGEWVAYIESVAAYVRAEQIDVVVFDTWSAVSPCDDENDAAGMMAALKPLHYLTEAGAAVLLVHHPKKGDAGEGQASRGSGALPGFVDTIIELRRHDPQRSEDRRRVLSGYGRFEETPRELVIELTDNGYATIGNKAEASQADRLKTIADILRDADEPLNPGEVLERWPEGCAIRPGNRTIRRDMEHGYENKQWARDGNGKKGDAYRYRGFVSCQPDPLETGNESNTTLLASQHSAENST